jgi:hypothetical protein
MPLVESDRFDDVDFRMIEEPGPPPRRRHRGLAVLGGLFVAGALALGASALAAPDEPVAPAAKPASFDSSSHWRHHGCHHGRSQRDRGQDSTLKY